MLIVLGVYGLVMWLIFSKFRILPWNGAWKTLIYSIAVLVALVVVGALNHLTPTGSVSIQGAMINITPNVSGTVIEVAIEPNTPISKGDVLFRIDDTTYAAEVARLEAALVSAKTAASQLQTDLDSAGAEIGRLAAQLEFGNQRRNDIVKLAERGASSDFQMQEAVSNIEQLEASLRGARARKAGIETRIASQIDGVDAGVAEVEQILVQARWSLEQTVVRAPGDGIVTALTLRPGNRVATVKAAMAFLPLQDRVMTAVFPQSSTHGIKIGDMVSVALRTMPGSTFETTVLALPVGSGEGAVDGRDRLPSLRDLTGASEFVAVLKIPEELTEDTIRLGSTGTALRITDYAGGIAVLAKVLFWISKLKNYL